MSGSTGTFWNKSELNLRNFGFFSFGGVLISGLVVYMVLEECILLYTGAIIKGLTEAKSAYLFLLK